MTKPTIADLQEALDRLIHRENTLLIFPQDTDEDMMLLKAIDELERLRRLETTAKATYEAFKQWQYAVHMGDQTQKPETEDFYSISYEEMLRMREVLADLERWFIQEECWLRGFEGCREASAENGHCFCGYFRVGEEERE